MIARIAFALIFTASPALAHPGHLIGAAGHDHIAAGIAIGVAIGLAAWGAIKGAKGKEEGAPASESPESPEPEAA